MAGRGTSWPPRGSRPDREDHQVGDREVPTARWGRAGTERSRNREVYDHEVDREVDREVDVDHEVSGADGPLGPGREVEVGEDREVGVGFLTPLQELRFVRQSPGTVPDHVDYAINGAYAMPERSQWRHAHIVFAYTVVPFGINLCRLIEWAFFQRLSRFLVAVPVALALLWALNHIPVTAWAIPDQWDVSTWLPQDAPADPGAVQMPVDPAPAGGAG